MSEGGVSIQAVLTGEAADQFVLVYAAAGVPFTLLALAAAFVLWRLPYCRLSFLAHAAAKWTNSLPGCFCCSLLVHILNFVTVLVLAAW